MASRGNNCLYISAFIRLYMLLAEEYIAPRGLALHDWDNKINNMKEKLDLPNLTLYICFADFYTITYTTPLRRQLTRAD